MTSWLALLLLGLVAPGAGASGPPPTLERDASTCESADVAPDATISACRSLLRLGGIDRADQAVIFFDLGRAYDLNGDNDRAIANYSAAISLDPDFAWAYYDRGRAYYGKGEYERAVADNDAALRLEPDDAAAFNNRGIAYLGEGNLDRAIAEFGQAIGLNPGLAPAFYNRGFAFFRESRFDR